MNKCINCRHCHQTKELVRGKDIKTGEICGGWKHYHICTLWLDEGETEEPLLLTLENANNEFCECFEEVKKDE